LTAKPKNTTNDVMKKRNIDYVLETNFGRRILDKKKNVNIENKNDQLLSISKYLHSKPLISNL